MANKLINKDTTIDTSVTTLAENYNIENENDNPFQKKFNDRNDMQKSATHEANKMMKTGETSEYKQALENDYIARKLMGMD